MGGNYQKSIYNQLMEVMTKLDAMDAEHKKDRKEIKDLTAEVTSQGTRDTACRRRTTG